MSDEIRHPEIVLNDLDLDGENFNPLTVLNRVREAMSQAGVNRDEIDEFTTEATAHDEDRFVDTVRGWVTVR